MNKIVLKDMPSNDGFVVENMNLNGVEYPFVHNTENGRNYFNQKVLASLFGVTQQNISKVLKHYKEVRKNYTTSGCIVSLTVDEKYRPVQEFNSFEVVNYLANRIDTEPALVLCEVIGNILNKMFNVATGKSELDTRIMKLKEQKEVEALKERKYQTVYHDLKSIDDDMAGIFYHKYKKAKHNGINIDKQLFTKDDWNKRTDKVLKDCGNDYKDNTEQTLLV